MGHTDEPGGGSPGNTPRHRRHRHRGGSGDIPTAPGGGGGGGGGPRTPGGSNQPPAGTSTGGNRDPYAYARGAEARANAKEMEARRRAQQKWLGQAATMQQQIDALKIALGKKGLRKALRQHLADVGQIVRQQLSLEMKGYRERVGSLEKTAADNEKAAAGQAYLNQANRGRERANATSEATAQGAGESDLLRAQGASLRNWNANQAEINRSFYDTLTSVNSSLTDLTADTRTAKFNIANQGNADRSALWTEYYGNRADVMTQLGNALGQQAEYYGLANEAIPKKGTRGQRTASSRQSGTWFDRSARMSGMAWNNPGVPKGIRNGKGVAEIEGYLNDSELSSRETEKPVARPEGATLREWR